MHFRYRRLDKCYSHIHSHGEFTQVELCLLVPDTNPFLTEFTTGLHSWYHSESSNRNILSFVQINHILDCKPHTQAGFYTQRYKLFNSQAFLRAFTTGLQSQHHRDSSYRHNPNLVQLYHISMIANSIHKQDFTQRTNNLWSAQSCLTNGLRSIPELGVWPEPWRELVTTESLITNCWYDTDDKFGGDTALTRTWKQKQHRHLHKRSPTL